MVPAGPAMDPLENLPPDLDKDFAKWFYGDIKSLMGAQPQRDLRPIVRRLIKKRVDKITPQAFKFLTQDLRPDELEAIKTFDYYRTTLKQEDSSPVKNKASQEHPSNITSSRPEKSKAGHSRQTSTQKTYSRNRNTNFLGPKKSLNLTLNKESVIVDRRKMVTRPKQTTPNNGRASPPLIAPEEDCDDSDT